LEQSWTVMETEYMNLNSLLLSSIFY